MLEPQPSHGPEHTQRGNTIRVPDDLTVPDVKQRKVLVYTFGSGRVYTEASNLLSPLMERITKGNIMFAEPEEALRRLSRGSYGRIHATKLTYIQP